jgi:hypothetical protein
MMGNIADHSQGYWFESSRRSFSPGQGPKRRRTCKIGPSFIP